MPSNIWNSFWKFLSAPALAWQSALKSCKTKVDLLTDIDLLLMAEKGSAKANNKYMKDYDKNKESPCLQDRDANNLYDRSTICFIIDAPNDN